MASAVSTAVAQSREESGGGGSAARSHRLPRWTRHEILVLIQGKRVVEGRGRRRAQGAAMVVEPKWAAVASYCRRHGMDRGALQCRKRWSNLACDFRKIRAWEKGPGAAEGESFWAMRNDRRRERGLPGFFDRAVYEILDGAVEVEVEAEGEEGAAAVEEDEGKKASALAEEENGEEEEEAIFDSGRTAADDGLFSDFEQEEAEEDERPQAMVVVPISERMYEPFSQESSDPEMVNDKQPNDGKEMGSSPRGQKRKRTSKEGAGDTNKLIEVLERNSKILTAQLEAQNINCQLDRDQRKDQANSLLGVLNKLADALGRIADKL
ncbi:trihelix transcription factor ASR3 [Elaeis guineensis]|uniref:Trihelix transcription factor ASR3 n=1 Tax=Elaeis guineensis var. tenera TaxID=51953 RepID=A0A8N4IA52_ELAGV|nr:trihelix transcription factor ASR3 [Elaeis guineensis]